MAFLAGAALFLAFWTGFLAAMDFFCAGAATGGWVALEGAAGWVALEGAAGAGAGAGAAACAEAEMEMKPASRATRILFMEIPG